jgi:pyruvate dehydrogenase E2 component (dihydrolipoamide acetyltransferase)
VPEPAAAGRAVARRTELTGARKTTARVVAESWREIPQFQQVVMADATNVLQARAALLAQNEGGDTRISLNDVLLDRVIAAVEEVPAINASYTDGVVTEYADIDVAVAVATDHGLLTPVLRRSNKTSLAQRAVELRELARRSAAGELRPEDLENPTITVSNLGMYGVDTGFALVTRPQAAVVFLGHICERPMVVDGSVVARSSLYLSVSYDHRVVDGAVAARFLSALRQSVERPGR